MEVVLTMTAPADFDSVYRAEYPALVAVAWALLGDRAAAEDVVQEGFLRAHHRWEQVGSYERPGAWVRRVVLNLATSRRRRLAVEARALRRWFGRHEATAVDAETESFWAAVRGLPRRQAQVVALYYVEDLSTDEIAEVLAVAPGTVRATLHQARRALAAALALEDEEV